MSLIRSVGAAVDAAFAHQRLQAFGRLNMPDGVSIRRYYRSAAGSECEVSVYRDKWWDKTGGTVYLELYCLVAEVQQLLGGCSQSWRAPDYDRPLRHFQYSTGRTAERKAWGITSADDIVVLGETLQDFLLAHGLAWFDQFDSRAGVMRYLSGEGAYVSLAELYARTGDHGRALNALGEFLQEQPREIESQLHKMVSLGIIDEQERRTLLRGSLQHQSDYEDCVRLWRRVRGL